MFLTLGIILILLGIIGVVWLITSAATRDKTSAERSGLTRVGATILAVVSLIAGGVAIFMALSGLP